MTCSSLQHCFHRDCWRVPHNKYKVFGDWECSGKTQSPFVTAQLSQSSAASYWKGHKVTEGGILLASSRRLKGDHEKLQLNCCCMLMGMVRTWSLGFQNRRFSMKLRQISVPILQVCVCRFLLKNVSALKYRFSNHNYVFLSQTDWLAVRLHAHHIATGSRGTSLLLHAYSACVAQNHAIVVDLGSITCAHTAYNKPWSCRTLACTRTLWRNFSLRLDQNIWWWCQVYSISSACARCVPVRWGCWSEPGVDSKAMGPAGVGVSHEVHLPTPLPAHLETEVMAAGHGHHARTSTCLLLAEIFHLAAGTYFFHAHGSICVKSKRHRIPPSQVSFGWWKRPGASHLLSHACTQPQNCVIWPLSISWLWQGFPYLIQLSKHHSCLSKGQFAGYTYTTKPLFSHSASLIERNQKTQFGKSTSMQPPSALQELRQNAIERKSCCFWALSAIGINPGNATEMGCCGFCSAPSCLPTC